MLFVLGVLVFSAPTLADKSFSDYKINSTPARLPVELVKKGSESLIFFASEMSSCISSTLTLTNPLISRDVVYRTSSSGSSCRVSVEFYSTWSYNCLLGKKDLMYFSNAIKVRAKNGAEVFGDMSDNEKVILFDDKICDRFNIAN
jgi:hypothetical protein